MDFHQNGGACRDIPPKWPTTLWINSLKSSQSCNFMFHPHIIHSDHFSFWSLSCIAGCGFVGEKVGRTWQRCRGVKIVGCEWSYRGWSQTALRNSKLGEDWYKLGLPPPPRMQSSPPGWHDIFRLGNPNLNLHLPLLDGGPRSKVLGKKGRFFSQQKIEVRVTKKKPRNFVASMYLDKMLDWITHPAKHCSLPFPYAPWEWNIS